MGRCEQWAQPLREPVATRATLGAHRKCSIWFDQTEIRAKEKREQKRTHSPFDGPLVDSFNVLFGIVRILTIFFFAGNLEYSFIFQNVCSPASTFHLYCWLRCVPLCIIIITFRYESIWLVFFLFILCAMQRTHFSVIRFGPPSKVKCFSPSLFLHLLCVCFIFICLVGSFHLTHTHIDSIRRLHFLLICFGRSFLDSKLRPVYFLVAFRSHFLWCFPWRLTFSIRRCRCFCCLRPCVLLGRISFPSFSVISPNVIEVRPCFIHSNWHTHIHRHEYTGA